MTATIHKFEAAGLGKAPFRVVGVENRVGPMTVRSRDGIETTVGAPGQPMGSCDYCGQGIKECWLIRSADGRDFVVGCDCVHKAGDTGLKRAVTEHEKVKRAAARDRARARGEVVVAEVEAMLEREDVRARLAACTHSRGFKDRETGRPLTYLDEVEWMLAHAGHSGRLATAKAVRALIAAPGSLTPVRA